MRDACRDTRGCRSALSRIYHRADFVARTDAPDVRRASASVVGYRSTAKSTTDDGTGNDFSAGASWRRYARPRGGGGGVFVARKARHPRYPRARFGRPPHKCHGERGPRRFSDLAGRRLGPSSGCHSCPTTFSSCCRPACGCCCCPYGTRRRTRRGECQSRLCRQCLVHVLRQARRQTSSGAH